MPAHVYRLQGFIVGTVLLWQRKRNSDCHQSFNISSSAAGRGKCTPFVLYFAYYFVYWSSSDPFFERNYFRVRILSDAWGRSHSRRFERMILLVYDVLQTENFSEFF